MNSILYNIYRRRPPQMGSQSSNVLRLKRRSERAKAKKSTQPKGTGATEEGEAHAHVKHVVKTDYKHIKDTKARAGINDIVYNM